MPPDPQETVAFAYLNNHGRLLSYVQTPSSNLIESPEQSINFQFSDGEQEHH